MEERTIDLRTGDRLTIAHDAGMYELAFFRLEKPTTLKVMPGRTDPVKRRYSYSADLDGVMEMISVLLTVRDDLQAAERRRLEEERDAIAAGELGGNAVGQPIAGDREDFPEPEAGVSDSRAGGPAAVMELYPGVAGYRYPDAAA
jgi:hypothetical protein